MPISRSNLDNIKSAIDQMNLEQLMELRIKVQADIEQMMRDLYVTNRPQNDYEQAMGEIPPDMPGLKNWAEQQGMSPGAAATVFGNTHPEHEITVVPNNPKFANVCERDDIQGA